MDARLQRRIQRYGWDKAAAYYDGYWAEQLKPAQERLLEKAAVQPGERVLDVACGTGLVTFPLAAAVGEEGEIVGTDLSAEMVERVSSEASERGVSNVSFQRLDAEDTSLPEASFDAVVCALGIMYVASPLEALKQFNRVLKAGGRAVVATWGARANCGWAEIFPIVDSRVRSEVCPMFFQQGTGETLRMTFEMAGFVEIEVDRISITLHYKNAVDACGAAFAGGPVALAYSRFDESTRAEAEAEYLASIEAYRRGERFEIPGEFVIAWGKPA
jgi:ubiquinone/menaquinone biosynthesis C-methylase UbiE